MDMIQVKRFTLEEYHELIDIGFLKEDDHIQLINGDLIEMVSKGRAHETCLRNLLRELPKLVGEKATLQSQSPIIIPPKSEPEPDFAIIRNRDDNYFSSHPQAEDILLVIEVADSSIKYDQDVKIPLYAKAGISDYWIFNLLDKCLECYSETYENQQGNFGYLNKRIFLNNQIIALPCFPDLQLDLSKVFPPS
ncbi:Uma2 family endonuclease [Sphaerospermopsis sp. LEGE 08334]|jgi:Uma2 family endonuclease|uniref:Uma2 family endonuclease n=1 Tax=Sphaerospermopsis sp. LEGE 08334 TaxID=1828651 RepID=UPI001882FC73|nr:Uma2 family endonuclease [Sphaerospermopsis sp. LEGE 08334]MBE9059331.1 Uma2 family endonuclease [Sphaerospermopsis sp. LEGE 08334]